MLRLYTCNSATAHQICVGKCFGTSIPLCAYNKSKRKQTSGNIDPQTEKCDCVGPPDPQSNIRVVNFYIPHDETPLEYRYRMSRVATQEWNQKFWADHNDKFRKMKEEFIKAKLREKYEDDDLIRKTLSAEEMSQFYKGFLDESRPSHLDYNKEWYKRNVNNLILAAKVWLEQKVKTKR